MITREAAADMAAPEVGTKSDVLRELFQTHYTPLLYLAQLLLNDRSAAEDAVQDAFIRLYRRFENLDEPDAAGAYLRVTVINVCRSTLRHRLVVFRHFQRHPEREGTVDDDAASFANAEVAIAALRRLSRRQRQCVVLRFYLDLPEAEVADRLGISVNSVKTHVTRGMTRLKELLRSEPDE